MALPVLVARRFLFFLITQVSEFIIVGHGLAGAVLAHRLLGRGKKVKVLDSEFPHSASEVSVGLVNPLIGPKLNPPEKILECLEENTRFFPEFEQAWGKSFYGPLLLHRIFISEKQKNRWFELKQDSKYVEFLGDFLHSEKCASIQIQAPFGAGITKRAFQLDVAGFLTASRKHLEIIGAWCTSSYREDEWTEKNKIIFCEGFRVQENQLFNHLPFAPARGETLRIKKGNDRPISNGSWYLPYGSEQAIIGSTWDHENLLCGPTNEGEKEILKNCDFVPVQSQQIEAKKSGVRSGTRDRNPILGVHKKCKNRFLFNGFGSRGTSTIPYYSKWMADFVLGNHPLPPQVNLSRFES